MEVRKVSLVSTSMFASLCSFVVSVGFDSSSRSNLLPVVGFLRDKGEIAKAFFANGNLTVFC